SNLTATPQEIRRVTTTMTTALNTWNFAAPTTTQIAYMEAAGQSFQVVDNLTLKVNLGYGYLGAVPYSYVLSTLAAPVSAAVDPAVVQANGGVTANAASSWMPAKIGRASCKARG